MAASKVVPLTCHGHSRPITHLSFSSMVDDDQYYLISACKDNNPMLRDGVTGDWIGTFIGHKGAVWQSRVSQGATLAITGSADFTAKVWDTHTGQTLYTLQHNHIVRAVDFAPGPDPKLVATGGMEKKLRIWDLNHASNGVNGNSSTDAEPSIGTTNVSSWELGAGTHEGTIKSIVWGPDPNTLVTAGDDKTVRWWDIRQKTQIAKHSLDGQFGSCELNRSSGSEANTVLSVGAGKTVYAFSSTTPGQLITSQTIKRDIASVAINMAESKFVAGGNSDTWVHVYNLADGKELSVHKGHHGPVWSVSFSPDGKLYASGSEDGTIKLWKYGNEAYGLWR